MSHRKIGRLALVCLGLGLIAGVARAATMPATEETLAAVLAGAHPGDTIQLQGVFGPREIIAPKGLTFDARAAILTNWEVTDARDVAFEGGVWRAARQGGATYGDALHLDRGAKVSFTGMNFIGPGESRPGQVAAVADGHGLKVLDSTGITVAGSNFSCFKGGLVLGVVDGYTVRDNVFSQMRAAGIQAGETRHGLVERNLIYGIRIVTDEHPDGIQFWSRPTNPPSSDITVRGNTVVGASQGVAFMNHVRPDPATGRPTDDGGFDRITIDGNDVWVSYPGGIVASDVRGLVLTRNRVRTAAGATYRASIQVDGNTVVARRAGNTVSAGAGKPSDDDP